VIFTVAAPAPAATIIAIHANALRIAFMQISLFVGMGIRGRVGRTRRIYTV
jgi:hypothetical protein